MVLLLSFRFYKLTKPVYWLYGGYTSSFECEAILLWQAAAALAAAAAAAVARAASIGTRS